MENKNWEVEFDKKFKIMEQVATDEVDGVFALESDREKVKDFIRSLLASQREPTIEILPTGAVYVGGVLNKSLTEKVRTIMASQRETLAVQIEGMKKNLVVDNWEDGQAKVCNPRCHDSGKEKALTDAAAHIRKQMKKNWDIGEICCEEDECLNWSTDKWTDGKYYCKTHWRKHKYATNN